jgi:hypothetical protein
MTNEELLKKIKKLVIKEKKNNEYKKRIRLKGIIENKILSKKENIILTINKTKFTILKNHKEKFKIAEQLKIKDNVTIEAIPKFKINICTKLKKLDFKKQFIINEF